MVEKTNLSEEYAKTLVQSPAKDRVMYSGKNSPDEVSEKNGSLTKILLHLEFLVFLCTRSFFFFSFPTEFLPDEEM